MKITKFIHSCLLIEDNKNILIDPGVYSTEALDVDALPKLDYLLLTHEHADHMDPTLVKEIVQKFSQVKVVSNPSVAELLKKEGINVETSGDSDISLEEVLHEPIFGGQVPANTLFKVLGKLTHPGDSHHFSLSTPFLAVPIQAPWGSTVEAVKLVEKLKPEVIIPIHDWHWRDEAREGMYKRLEEYFGKAGIKFIGLETGKTVEV